MTQAGTEQVRANTASKPGKGKEEYLYSTFWPRWYTQSAEAWITQFYLQITPCLPSFVSIHQMSPPHQLMHRTSNCSSLLIYRCQKDEWLQVKRRTAKARRPKTNGSVTARHSSVGRQPNFVALNRGRHISSAGRPSRWALVHISRYY